MCESKELCEFKEACREVLGTVNCERYSPTYHPGMCPARTLAIHIRKEFAEKVKNRLQEQVHQALDGHPGYVRYTKRNKKPNDILMFAFTLFCEVIDNTLNNPDTGGDKQ